MGDAVGANGLEGKKAVNRGTVCDGPEEIDVSWKGGLGVKDSRDGADRIKEKDVYSLLSVAYWSWRDANEMCRLEDDLDY